MKNKKIKALMQKETLTTVEAATIEYYVYKKMAKETEKSNPSFAQILKEISSYYKNVLSGNPSESKVNPVI